MTYRLSVVPRKRRCNIRADWISKAATGLQVGDGWLGSPLMESGFSAIFLTTCKLGLTLSHLRQRMPRVQFFLSRVINPWVCFSFATVA
jgi:hypothetical protein